MKNIIVPMFCGAAVIMLGGWLILSGERGAMLNQAGYSVQDAGSACQMPNGRQGRNVNVSTSAGEHMNVCLVSARH